MAFHGTIFLGPRIPWNSIEFDIGVKFHGIPWNHPYDQEKFHEIPWKSMEFFVSSMEFHGIQWNSKILILINFIIREVYVTVCCMIFMLYIRQSISS